jgi:4-hydroxy-4-methyl-2-oxoglutarate aldolase
MNSWPIDALQRGDVYVADGFGKIHDGTLIGDNLGNSIFAKSGNGVIFDGSVRDLQGRMRSTASTRSSGDGIRRPSKT